MTDRVPPTSHTLRRCIRPVRRERTPGVVRADRAQRDGVTLAEEEPPPSLTATPRFGEIRRLIVSLGLGAAAGVIAGVSGLEFLEMLDSAISFREETAPWLLWLLPAGAFVIAAADAPLGGRSKEGTRLVVGAARGTEPGSIPGRMLGVHPVRNARWSLLRRIGWTRGRGGADHGKLAETWRARSVGAIHGEVAGRLHRRGLRGLFGVPFAGTVFALEVAWRGRRWRDVVPVGGASLLAGSLGHWFVGALGHEQSTLPAIRYRCGAMDARAGVRRRAGLRSGRVDLRTGSSMGETTPRARSGTHRFAPGSQAQRSSGRRSSLAGPR